MIPIKIRPRDSQGAIKANIIDILFQEHQISYRPQPTVQSLSLVLLTRCKNLRVIGLLGAQILPSGGCAPPPPCHQFEFFAHKVPKNDL